MLPHHAAWLSAHPERSAEWLAERVAEGFHVHHVDGDHDNNDQLNLVLIESGDHMMLHNGSSRLLWKPAAARSKNGGRKKNPTIEELEARIVPLIEARNRKKNMEFRAKMRGIGRASYANSGLA